MATSNDHPGLPFVQAQGYTRGRPDGPALWIAWHSMEASEWSGRAESTAAYFASPGDGRSVSAHHCGDDNSVIQCVDEDDSAWTVGNRPGNYRGVNIELAGFARQSRADWLDPFGVAMFARLAPIVAASMTRWHIPNRWCSVADLKAFRPGHTTHNDLRLAFGGTTHTDPGAGFPRDYVAQVLAAALNPMEDDMATMYVIETGLEKTPENPTGERVIASTGVHSWWVRDFGPLAARGIAFPTQRVTSQELRDSFGVNVEQPAGGAPVPGPHDHTLVLRTGPAEPLPATD